MRVPRLTLDDLRARFAERPAALLDMVEDIAARLSRSGEPGGLPTPMAAAPATEMRCVFMPFPCSERVRPALPNSANLEQQLPARQVPP